MKNLVYLAGPGLVEDFDWRAKVRSLIPPQIKVVSNGFTFPGSLAKATALFLYKPEDNTIALLSIGYAKARGIPIVAVNCSSIIREYVEGYADTIELGVAGLLEHYVGKDTGWIQRDLEDQIMEELKESAVDIAVQYARDNQPKEKPYDGPGEYDPD